MRPNRSKFLFLNCSDSFDADLTYEITDQPDFGTLSGSGQIPHLHGG